MEQMRKEFEEWFSGQYIPDGDFVTDWRYVKEKMLESWQASKATRVVELPAPYQYPDGVEYLDQDAVIFALEQAGVKYK